MSAEYELILMLDPEAPDEHREQIAGNARELLESGGALRHSDSWGVRKLAYEIQQRTEADYRFFRFEAEPPVLEDLDHKLKIADGILRFRVFKVDPRAPLIEPPAAAVLGSPRRRDERGGRGRGDGRPGAREEEETETTPAEEPAAAAQVSDEPAAEEPAAATGEGGAGEEGGEASSATDTEPADAARPE